MPSWKNESVDVSQRSRAAVGARMEVDWRRVKEVFFAAVETEGAKRAEFVERECGEDRELRDEVNRLLDEHHRRSDPLASPLKGQWWGERDLAGSAIAHYRIDRKIGSGGMGVVYRAEDIRLRRTVALKFLSPDALGERETKARLIREAQASASLDHPNICHTYGIHENADEIFIAIAYIDGPSLADKIRERPLPLGEALDIAIQIAEGLREAHENGIVHRDIKPHNVMLTAKGQVKITDFGLASVAGRSRITKSGAALGTPSYMAPERLAAQQGDRRADIWALGCVLYEMLTQRNPFEADHDQAIVHGILNEEPEPVTAQRRGVPPKLDDLLEKALSKRASDRYQHVDDLLVDLRLLRKDIQARKASSGNPAMLGADRMSRTAVPATGASHEGRLERIPHPEAVAASRSRHLLERVVAVAATVAFLGLLAFRFTEWPSKAPRAPTRRFSISQEGLSSASISPDGRNIAFATGTAPQSSIRLRAIGAETTREIPGTEGARPQLGWAPDGKSIVFATRTQVKRVDIDGSDPITLGDLRGTGFDGFRGVSWSPDGERIAFGSSRWVFEIPAKGGDPKVLVDRDLGDVEQPHFLPATGGPDALVYQTNVDARTQIWVLNLETGERSELGPGSDPIYSEPGYLLHGPGERGQRGLHAMPFSLSTLAPAGRAFPISTDGHSASVAADGTLVYLDGFSPARQHTLVWRNRKGELLEAIGQPQPSMLGPSISPDGRRIAVSSMESGDFDVWIHDLVGSAKTRLTFSEARELSPAWSPSGTEVAYSLIRGRVGRLLRKAADGSGEAVVLVESEGGLWSPEWSPDARYLAYTETTSEAGRERDIRYIEFRGDGEASRPVTFLGTSVGEAASRFSPDGRHLAYRSDESGRDQIYVRPFPDGAGKWQVSVNGGENPRWRGDGKELFYVEDGGTLMAVSVATEPTFAVGRPHRLFQSADLMSAGVTNYDVTKDGERFVTISTVEVQGAATAPPRIRVVQNWVEEVREPE